MNRQLIAGLTLALTLLAGQTLADEVTTCTFGSQERVISVVYLEPGYPVPCEVQYQKDGATQTLWSAQNEVGYCEAKASELVENLRTWGWTCELAVAEMETEPQPEMASGAGS